jgi:hypothetical protein
MSLIDNAGTYSSNEIETTPSANFVIDFPNSVNVLAFVPEGNALNLKINNEPNWIYLKDGDNFNIEKIYIDKITIKESGVKYRYYALFY